jgi:uncharacterized pyridoxamine 5'-phosphate oxidase family protein
MKRDDTVKVLSVFYLDNDTIPVYRMKRDDTVKVLSVFYLDNDTIPVYRMKRDDTVKVLSVFYLDNDTISSVDDDWKDAWIWSLMYRNNIWIKLCSFDRKMSIFSN